MPRLMFRNDTGTTLRPGVSVIRALDTLCEYEEICATLGVDSPAALRRFLGQPAQEAPNPQKAGPMENPTDQSMPIHGPWYMQHCEACGHYEKGPSGYSGICRKHPKKVRVNGGKRPEYEVFPDKPRPVARRRAACKSFLPRGSEPKPGAEVRE